jgi:hypothetical protein
MTIPVIIQIKPACLVLLLSNRLKIIETNITLSIPNNISIKVNGIKLSNTLVENISDMVVFLEYKNRNKKQWYCYHIFSK